MKPPVQHFSRCPYCNGAKHETFSDCPCAFYVELSHGYSEVLCEIASFSGRLDPRFKSWKQEAQHCIALCARRMGYGYWPEHIIAEVPRNLEDVEILRASDIAAILEADPDGALKAVGVEVEG